MSKQTQRQRDTQKPPPEPIIATATLHEEPDRTMTQEEVRREREERE
jgi:hypothetical protein